MTTTKRAPQSLVLPMRKVLRVGLLAGALGLVLGGLIGYLLAGLEGLWGVLMGLGISVLFFTLTVVLALVTARMRPQMLGAAILGSWLVKIAALIAILAVLREQDFYSKPLFFVALLLGTFGYLGMEAWVVLRTKVLYLETEFAPDEE